MIFRSKPLLLMIGALAILLSACAPLVQLAQPEHTDFVRLSGSESIGQTFHSRFGGLQAIVVYLKKENPEAGSLVFSLHGDARADGPLVAQRSLPLDSAVAPGFQRFRFPALPSSNREDYFLEIKYDGQGSVHLGRGAQDAYLDGALYQNGTPRDLQLTFRLIYEPRLALIGLLPEIFSWLTWLLAAIWLLILPGWLILGVTLPGWKALTGGEKAGLAAGFSLALYPLILLIGDLVYLPVGNYFAWLLPVVGVILSAASYFHRRRKIPPAAVEQGLRKSRSEPLANLVLIVLLFGIIFTRFWPARDLAMPMFGDSYQHAVITQLLIDNNGLFSSWMPYAELTTFTYHFGFHAAALAFHDLTRLPAPLAVLWLGQILNVLAVLSLYPLGVRLSGSRWGGIVALLVAGLLVSMPMDYTNWGRYPQLAGQVILPAFAWLAWDILEERSYKWQSAVLAGIALGGLALTHFRILAFALVFLLICTLFHIRKDSWLRTLALASVSLLTAGILFLPWFIRTYAGKMLEILTYQLTTPASNLQKVTPTSTAIGDLFIYLPAWLWLALPALIAWGFWRRDKKIALISLWWFVNLWVANPQWLNLPGAGAITSFTVFIAAYIPASVIVGAAAYWLIAAAGLAPGRQTSMDVPVRASKTSAGQQRMISFFGLIALLVFSLQGARQRLEDLSPEQYALVTHPDMRAVEWMRANMPPQARLLVNAFSAFDGYSVVGSDAGWWLPLLAQRQTSLPPINYSFEQGPDPDFRLNVNSLVENIEIYGVASPVIHHQLLESGFTHVFIGQRQGSVNHPGIPALDADILRSSPYYRTIYHQDRVWIFEILPAD